MLDLQMKGAVLRFIGFVVIAALLAGSLSMVQPAYGYGSVCGGWIGYGDVIYDSVPTTGGCTYYFRGHSNDMVKIEMTKRSSSLDPYLTVYDSYGTVIIEDDDSAGNGNSKIDYLRLPRTGTYELLAGAYQGRSYGPFRLSLSLRR